MSWPFCNQCGSILESPTGDYITCDLCGFSCKFTETMGTSEVVTFSVGKPKPAWLISLSDEDDALSGAHQSITSDGYANSKRSKAQSPTGKSSTNRTNKHAVIEEPCPKCGHPEMYFYTMQLRSVDEGSTVFYECPKCTHKFSVNN